MGDEWLQMTDEQQRQHNEELLADWKEWDAKKEPWWKHLDEWMKEKVSGHEQI